MDRLKMHSLDKVQENIKKIAELFPNTLTEVIKGYRKDGTPVIQHAVDFDVLRQELSDIIVEGPDERYRFTWPDKNKSILLANAPIAKTLRPCRNESVNFDTTENLYIEGDNLDVLKLLQETYLGKIKMIFIDPPYNTGNDFVYRDNFALSTGEYLANSGQFDENGNRLVHNTESNGRFHTNWLNMMYPRLKLAKDLLSEDGVIFITIDDGENANLRKICDEIFGPWNFVTEFIWEKKKKPSFLHRNVGKLYDYILCYAKNSEKTSPFSIETTTRDKKYPINNAGNGRSIITFPPLSVEFPFPDMVIEPQDMSEGKIFTELLNTVVVKDYKNQTEIVLNGEWRYTQKKINKIIGNGEKITISKIPFRPNHIKSGGEIKKMKNILSPAHYDCETNEDGTSQVISLFGSEVFDTPKPVKLIKLLIQAATYNDKDAIVLDFFSGASTTAHAVLKLNAEDGGNRRFIMVQLPEPCAENSEACKAGFRTIAEIGKERIRRAGKRILEEHPEASGRLDTGFRVLKLDSSNMHDVCYSPEDYSQELLLTLADNIKPDRTPEDLLFQVMLDLGVLLSSKIEETAIGDKKVFSVADGYLIACFDKNITTEVVTGIAKMKPYYAVFRDSGMENDSVAANFEQIFKTFSPSTIRKIL